ncbi:hypothetical protein BCR44DRAFT_1058973 [Catenaria anguillulae PL171]|uniref:Folliculin DENN domain-containing protein n=1 Tax=Catenaria anguillulae PL171 TaxID=765915 RepID=A0A1Y2HQC0_9FUNG|nr:hypothetical protein BCR44DRAFT_1058973 [Catenaria anguillulae PL171]
MSLASTSSSSPAVNAIANHHSRNRHRPRHLPSTTSATDPALTVLFHLAFHLPRPDLLILLTHLATGDQIIVRGACDLATPLLHALAYVLPDDCATVVENSPTYRESWECNLLGVDSYVALPLNTLRENGAGYCVVDVDEVSVRVAYDYLPAPAAAVTGGGGGAGTGASAPPPANPRASMGFGSTGAGAPTGAGAGVGGLPSVSRIAADVARAVDGAKALAGSQWLAAHPCMPPTAGSTTGAAALLGSSASTSSLRWAANAHHHLHPNSAASSSDTCLPPRVLAALRLALGRVQTSWLTRAGDFAAMVRRATLYSSTAAHVSLSPFATAANPATAVVGALVNPESAVPMALAHCHANMSEWSIGSTGSGASGVSHYSPQGGGGGGAGSASATTAAAAARPIVSAARAVAKQASLLSLSSLLGSSWRKNSSSSSVNVSGAGGVGPGASSSSAAHVTASILSSSPATVSGATGKQYLGNVRRAAPTAHPSMGSSGMAGNAMPAPASLASLFPSSSVSATGAGAPLAPPYISTGSSDMRREAVVHTRRARPCRRRLPSRVPEASGR